jgi:NAD(P)-dependent dehydrogenase (short-subunit alcohol dehydrogenase family)
MAKWQPRDMPSQEGKLAIVTGANSGIGFHTALLLARAGARVILGCRGAAKCEAARQDIARITCRDCVEAAVLDLADLDSVRRFAQEFLAGDRKLDLLVNNAGVMAVPERQTTKQGFELQFGVNFLAHFALTGLLLPALLKQNGSRVVTISSIAHKTGQIDFDDLQAERSYSPWKAYRQSKLADLIFGLELERRLRRAGKSTESLVAHPGVAATNLFRSGPGQAGGLMRTFVGDMGILLVAQSEDRGSWPTLYAATAPEASGGHFYGPDGFREMRGTPVEVHPAPQALDAATAQRLWSVAEQLTGVRYPELDTQGQR